MAGMTRKKGGSRMNGGSSCTMKGGKRPLSSWNKLVMSVFAEMKKKHGKKVSFKDALKEASKRKGTRKSRN